MFERSRRSVCLTEAGMRILPDIQAGLETLARAIDSTAGLVKEKSLTISVTPSFASKWLLPRLSDFSERHPDIDLRISATVALADLKRDGVDLAIRLGHGPYPDARAEPLFGEALTPLCSPALIRRKGRLKTPDDLRKYPLLHDSSIPGESEQNSWQRWLNFAGAKNVPHRRGTRFSLAELAMQAAIEGAGVVLGRVVLAEADVAAGRLIRPFRIVMPMDVTYFIVTPKSASLRHEAQCFRDWLIDLATKPVRQRQARGSA